jgi:large subunit ribosomal protein L10
LAITKNRKKALVTQYHDLLVKHRGIVLASFVGLSVKEQEDLRRKVRELGGEFLVVKNTLAKLAFQQAGLPVPEEALLGTTVVGGVSEDVPALAKTIVEAAKRLDSIRVKAGVIDGVLYSGKQIEQLAELPPIPVVRAQFLGLLQAPATRMVGALAGSVRQVATVLKAFSEAGAAPAAS